MDSGNRLTAREMDQVVADAQNRVRASFDTMPVFGVTGWTGPVMVGEWSWHDGSRGLAHGNPDGAGSYVQVHTHPAEARVGVHELRSSSSDAPGGASTLDGPPDRLAEIVVDATPVVFEVWDDATRSWAGGNYLQHGIVIESRRTDIDDLGLHSVDDIEPYLAGQLDLIRRARREIGLPEI